jgi:hypothetical protein
MSFEFEFLDEVEVFYEMALDYGSGAQVKILCYCTDKSMFFFDLYFFPFNLK